MAIGYACLTLGVYETQLCKVMAKNISDEKLTEVIRKNLNALKKMILFNQANGITLFRISSDIIPFASHPLNKLIWWEVFKDELMDIGNLIKKSPIRVSMHPGQYTVLNSPDEQVVQRAIQDLIYHERFLTTLGMDYSHKLILHIGGIYGDKQAAIKRFIDHYHLLPECIKERLIIENDEKCYNIQEVCEISEMTHIPVVFDCLHHEINPPMQQRTIQEWIEYCYQTWQEKDGIPKIHYSQQAINARRGAHSQTIKIEPFLQFYQSLKNKNIDIMLEVKDKNLSALKCSYIVAETIEKKLLEREWGRYKYLVLSQSATYYYQMRQLMKLPPKEAIKPFYELIEKSWECPKDQGACQNAALHVWGYFKKICTESEKKIFHKKLDAFLEGKLKEASLKNYLLKLAQKYQQMYLLNSYYFLDHP